MASLKAIHLYHHVSELIKLPRLAYRRSSKGLFSASGAIECRLREALRVKTWCRGSQNVCTHLPRGRGNYGCHRSRPRWGSLTDRFQSQSRVLAIAVRPKLLVTIEQTQNLLLGFSQKVLNHVPVTSRAHGATTCLSRTIMCHTLLHNNSYQRYNSPHPAEIYSQELTFGCS
eukprot:COSAG05_NODE_365_length_10774_cov_121.347822_4_plen_172_part_00